MRARNKSFIASVVTLIVLSGCTAEESGNSEAPVADQVSTGETFTSQFDTRKALALNGYWEAVPDDGVELGLGWDSREGRIVPNRCVKISPVHSPGQTTMMSLDEVSSRSDVTSALNVSASASVKTMFASGSASASFAKSTKVSSQSTTLLMKATVTNGVLFAGPADSAAISRTAYPAAGAGGELHASGKDSGRLTFYPWATALLKKPDEFRAYCGDGFISAISSGARLLASFEISGQSSSARKTTAASLKGSYGPANVSGSANSASSTKASMENVSVRYLQIGGAKGPIATTKDALDLKLTKLAGEAYESPRFQDMRITPYAQMAEVRFDPLWRAADDEYEMVADTYWLLTSLEDDVRHVMSSIGDYDPRTGMSDTELQDFLDDILDLRRAIFAALEDPGKAVTDFSQSEKALNLFSASPPQSKLTLPRGVNLKALGHSASLGELAKKLSHAFPYGNPTLLLINLPLPAEQSTTGLTESEELQNAVVTHYIEPIARRACQRDPTDRDCMSNRQLRDVAKLVPIDLARANK